MSACWSRWHGKMHTWHQLQGRLQPNPQINAIIAKWSHQYAWNPNIKLDCIACTAWGHGCFSATFLNIMWLLPAVFNAEPSSILPRQCNTARYNSESCPHYYWEALVAYFKLDVHAVALSNETPHFMNTGQPIHGIKLWQAVHCRSMMMSYLYILLCGPCHILYHLIRIRKTMPHDCNPM